MGGGAQSGFPQSVHPPPPLYTSHPTDKRVSGIFIKVHQIHNSIWQCMVDPHSQLSVTLSGYRTLDINKLLVVSNLLSITVLPLYFALLSCIVL